MAEPTIRLVGMGLAPTQEVIDLLCDAGRVACWDREHPGDLPLREQYVIDPARDMAFRAGVFACRRRGAPRRA